MEADICGSALRYYVKQLRSADHKAGKGKVAGRICRLLHELLDHTIVTDFYDAAAAGVGHLVEAEGCRWPALAVQAQHAGEVGAVEDVGVENPKEIIGGNPFAIHSQGSRTAQQLPFGYDSNRHSTPVAFEEFPNCLSVGVHIDEYFIDSDALAQLQPDGEQGYTLDRDQAFRSRIGDGSQPHSVAARQQKCLHQLPLDPTRILAFSAAPGGLR